jgi:ubiquitin thioesterase protein OTUB1
MCTAFFALHLTRDPMPCHGWESSVVDPAFNDEVTNQFNAIKQDIASSQPLLTELMDVAPLVTEFMPESGFARKIPALSAAYPCMRRARGDGNCFYRSFAFGYLERLLLDRDTVEITRMQAVLARLKEELAKQGNDASLVEEFCGFWVKSLDDIEKNLMSPAALGKQFNEGDFPTYGVFFLRLATQAEMVERSEFFAPFCFEEASVAKFCEKNVAPAGEEAEQVQIIAMSDALGVPVKVVYVDDSPSDKAVEHVFEASAHRGAGGVRKTAAGAGAGSIVTLLYRPGHYDVLYEAGNPACAK